MSIQEDKIATGDGDMKAALALPSDTGTQSPGVIVLHELFGLNDDIRRITGRFAANGYVALAPDLYSVGPRLKPICIRRTMQALRSGSGRAFEDIEAARDSWLLSRWRICCPRGGPSSDWCGGRLLRRGTARSGGARGQLSRLRCLRREGSGVRRTGCAAARTPGAAWSRAQRHRVSRSRTLVHEPVSGSPGVPRPSLADVCWLSPRVGRRRLDNNARLL